MSRRTQRKETTRSIDYLLLVILFALLAYGLLMLYSATFYVGMDFWVRQLQWVGLGVLVMGVMVHLPYTMLQRLAAPVLGMTLVLLLLVLLMGDKVLGAQRSIEVLGISIQPGILARITAVIYIAAWLASKGDQLNQVGYGLIPFAVISGVVAGFVALQPDLSTALLIVVTGLAMFFFAGGDPIQIFLSILTGGATFGLMAWQLPHARQRLLEYLVALKDPAQMPYHVNRAMTAISEGGLFGVGIGNGRLKAGYLPFPHTDSVFAVIGEEVGLLGTLFVLALFLFLAYRGYQVSLGTPDPFASLLAFGLTTMIITEVLLNVMVLVGLIPFTGTALPFFSYGGSEMLVTMAGAGLLLNISRGRPRRDEDAVLDRRWRDWWAYLSSFGRRSGTASH